MNAENCWIKAYLVILQANKLLYHIRSGEHLNEELPAKFSVAFPLFCLESEHNRDAAADRQLIPGPEGGNFNNNFQLLA